MELLYIIIIIIIIFLVIYYLNTIRKELFFNNYKNLLTDFKLTVTKISKEEITYDVSFKLTDKVITAIRNNFNSNKSVRIRWAPNYYSYDTNRGWLMKSNERDRFKGHGTSPKYNTNNLNKDIEISIKNIKQLAGNQNGIIDIEHGPNIVPKYHHSTFFTENVKNSIDNYTEIVYTNFVYTKFVYIKSNDNCPIMKSLYDNIFYFQDTVNYHQKDNPRKLQLKNEYIEFENKINSTFYNVDSYVKLELLDSKKEDKLVYLIKQEDGKIKNYPEIEFNDVIYNNKINNLHNRLFKLYGIKANYNLEDILKFFRLCFDLECKYIVKLNFTKLTDANNDGIYKYKSTYYQIPIRILLKAINEGKTYTRARKHNTNENIIIYFDEKPNINIPITKDLEGQNIDYPDIIPVVE